VTKSNPGNKMANIKLQRTVMTVNYVCGLYQGFTLFLVAREMIVKWRSLLSSPCDNAGKSFWTATDINHRA